MAGGISHRKQRVLAGAHALPKFPFHSHVKSSRPHVGYVKKQRHMKCLRSLFRACRPEESVLAATLHPTTQLLRTCISGQSASTQALHIANVLISRKTFQIKSNQLCPHLCKGSGLHETRAPRMPTLYGLCTINPAL